MKFWHDEIKCDTHYPNTLKIALFIIAGFNLITLI